MLKDKFELKLRWSFLICYVKGDFRKFLLMITVYETFFIFVECTVETLENDFPF